MAAIPVPSVNTPTYQSWGAAVATRLNTSASGQTGAATAPANNYANGAFVDIANAPAGVYFGVVAGMIYLSGGGNCKCNLVIGTAASGDNDWIAVPAGSPQNASFALTHVLTNHAGGLLRSYLRFGGGTSGDNYLAGTSRLTVWQIG